MKKILNMVLIASFAASWIYTGGVTVRYPVLERLLTHIDSQYPAELAREIRSHTDANSMCGVHAVVSSNQQSLQHVHAASVSHVPLPISSFVLNPSLTIHAEFGGLVSHANMACACDVVPPPPRLLA
jgi:hypothetical protein